MTREKKNCAKGHLQGFQFEFYPQPSFCLFCIFCRTHVKEHILKWGGLTYSDHIQAWPSLQPFKNQLSYTTSTYYKYIRNYTISMHERPSFQISKQTNKHLFNKSESRDPSNAIETMTARAVRREPPDVPPLWGDALPQCRRARRGGTSIIVSHLLIKDII